MLTFQVLSDRVARYLQQTLTGNYATRNIAQYLNETYRELWDMDEWPQTLTDAFEVTVPASTSYFVLPKNVQSVLRGYVGTLASATNSRNQIRVLGMAEFSDATELRSATNGQFIAAVAPFGTQGVLNQPTSEEVLYVVSDDNDDITQIVFIRGEDSDGNLISETLTLAGTTPVPTSRAYDSVATISKNAVTEGIVSLLDNAQVVTLAQISQKETSPLYTKYRVDTAPTAATVLSLIGKRRFQPFADKADTAFCDMDLALVDGSVFRAWTEMREPALAQLAKQRYDADVDELRRRELNADGSVELFVPMLRA